MDSCLAPSAKGSAATLTDLAILLQLQSLQLQSWMRTKFLMACYVLIAEILTLGVVFFLSSRHFMLVPAVIRHRVIQQGYSTTEIGVRHGRLPRGTAGVSSFRAGSSGTSRRRHRAVTPVAFFFAVSLAELSVAAAKIPGGLAIPALEGPLKRLG